MTSQNGWNLQRVIALDPSRFAKSLLYHPSYSKLMRLGSSESRKRLVKVSVLLGQVNAVKANGDALRPSINFQRKIPIVKLPFLRERRKSEIAV